MRDAPCDRRVVTGWGRATRSAGVVVTPPDEEAWRRLLVAAGPRGVTPRGAGCGYGDCAHNAGGYVATTRAPAPIDLDETTGTVEVRAGTTLGEIMAATAPRGWILPVVPGTGEVTVGGAIAADVHGKNHPAAGAFGAYVTRLTLLAPGRGPMTVGPDERGDIFWATVGGLGLTGVIHAATLRLRPVTSTWMAVRDRVVDDLGEALRELTDPRPPGAYAVAWLDGYRRGRRLGGGVVSVSRHLDLGDVPERRALRYPAVRRLPLPAVPWRGLVGSPVVRAANRLHRLAARRRGRGEHRVRVAAALHPLDAIHGLPGLYGSRGLVQYQFMVPPAAESVLAWALVEAQRAGCVPTLAVLKRLGAADPAPLSFPAPGWTLALDFPAGLDGLPALLDALDARIAEVGGRVYLVKDARLRPDVLAAMYPGLPAWRAVRDDLDPDHVLTSDLDRRLDLTGRRAPR